MSKMYPAATSFVFICICSAAIIAVSGLTFKAVHDSTGNDVCAAGINAVGSVRVRSRLECSSACLQDESCVSFNVKWKTIQQGVRPVCEMFNYVQAVNLTSLAGCSYYIRNDPGAEQSQHPDFVILVQQRVDRDTTFFNRTWAEFKVGFGSESGNYWIGNDLLHQLANTGLYKLRFDLQSATNLLWYTAEYSTFSVSDEAGGYRLTIGGFSGNASSDAMNYVNGTKFTTTDRDNDPYAGNCASTYEGGFWYNDCYYSCVNAGKQPSSSYFIWTMPPGAGASLLKSRMWLVSACIVP